MAAYLTVRKSSVYWFNAHLSTAENRHVFYRRVLFFSPCTPVSFRSPKTSRISLIGHSGEQSRRCLLPGSPRSSGKKIRLVIMLLQVPIPPWLAVVWWETVPLLPRCLCKKSLLLRSMLRVYWIAADKFGYVCLCPYSGNKSYSYLHIHSAKYGMELKN